MRNGVLEKNQRHNIGPNGGSQFINIPNFGKREWHFISKLGTKGKTYNPFNQHFKSKTLQ